MSAPTSPSTAASHVALASALSVTVSAVLVATKAVVLMLSGSPAILASLTDSGLDLLASLITFFAVRYARTPPDKEHPFGHGKAEAFSALFQGALLFASGALIMQDCLHILLHPQPARASTWSIAVLVLSLVLTFVLVTVQTRALKNEQSVAVSADRMHYLTDFVTNIIGLIGVVVAAAGFPIFDPLAGFVMAAWFLWTAIGVFREASTHLMDEALPDDAVAHIREVVMTDPRILGLHELRTRLAGPWILIQMHVELDPRLSLADAHTIIIAAENRLIEVYPNADIIIHPDPKGLAEPHAGVFHGGDVHEAESGGASGPATAERQA
ncbi:cation diffusion facilitator family transporter [Asticcacaulis solisilvae]|uniref:cation diffusion facilitator family transporter n=1 Tax=Asticcacaulis solisilvae TaxID=1217274 RepID=UPI003FD842E6